MNSLKVDFGGLITLTYHCVIPETHLRKAKAARTLGSGLTGEAVGELGMLAEGTPWTMGSSCDSCLHSLLSAA